MPGRRVTNLSPAELTALHEFGRFYDERRESIHARAQRIIAESAGLATALLPLTEEPGAGQVQTDVLQTQAIFEGKWEPYFERLRGLGERYARTGVSYSTWFELMRVYRTAVTEEIANLEREHRQRDLTSVLTYVQGLDCLADLALEQIGHAYITTLQRDLSRTEESHRSLFEHSPLPMWTFDRETLRFLTVNEAAVRHYGYTRDEFARMTLADIRPAEDIPALHADVANANGFSDRTLWRHRKKDGTVISVEVRANDLDVGGRPVRLVLITDVTERVKTEQLLGSTEEQLRHAQKMEAVGRLAGGVAHDFNNLLTVVQSYACLLEESFEASDTKREEAAEIRRAAERGAGITRQLLTLARQGVAEPRAVDIAALLNGLMPMLQRLVGDSVRVSLQCQELPKVIVNPGQLEQVVMNLVINARDAMPDGGRVLIDCHTIEVDSETAQPHQIKPGPYVQIAVTDTGAGMAPEIQHRIFEPFFTTKDAGQGTGLGLSIVHGIVTQAGGRIVVYSEPGHGTTFRVQLPVASDVVPASEVAQTEAPRVLRPLRVLVVDDLSDIRSVTARILREAGCTVVEATNAEEARKICVRSEESIDIALLDVVLPDGRGDVLLDELRALRPGMAIVLMSGYPAGALRRSGASPEMLLAKPFSPSELRAAVARASAGLSRPSPPSAKSDERARVRVLVADDDEPFRRIIVRILRKAELDVVDVDSGFKALTALESGPFDVVVSDVQMPDGGGLDLLRAVRRVDLDVPVILMTGDPSVAAAAEAVEYGAFRYLTKPLDTEAFLSTVKHAARAHALARIRREAYNITGEHAGVSDRAGLEVRFDLALEGMWMAFQPIVHASNGALFGMEALMRVSEPSFPHPGALLDAATQLGRVPLVGRRVRALSSAAYARRSDQIAMFVNLHPDDLHDVDLIDEAAPLTQFASRVILEVTERSALESSPKMTERIARLRQLGFRIAVDDIGAGYSGLTSFTELTPEIVKIDMSLVRDVHKSALKQRTIGALCRLCHEVGALVVGEGVETVEERDALVGLGCDLLQGYLIGRPQREMP